MTERQKRFVDNYVRTGNAALSAREAGYSAKSARQIGEKLLTKVDISRGVEERLADLAGERIADARESLEKVTAILRGEETEIIVTPSGKKVETPARIGEKLRAAELIMKVNGLFKEKVDLEVGGGELLAATLEKIWNERLK